MSGLSHHQIAEIALRAATEVFDGIVDPPWEIEFTDNPNGGATATWVKRQPLWFWE